MNIQGVVFGIANDRFWMPKNGPKSHQALSRASRGGVRAGFRGLRVRGVRVVSGPAASCYYLGKEEGHVGQAFHLTVSACQDGKPVLLPCRRNSVLFIQEGIARSRRCRGRATRVDRR